jgi:hypothetical protein
LTWIADDRFFVLSSAASSADPALRFPASGFH